MDDRHQDIECVARRGTRSHHRRPCLLLDVIKPSFSDLIANDVDLRV